MHLKNFSLWRDPDSQTVRITPGYCANTRSDWSSSHNPLGTPDCGLCLECNNKIRRAVADSSKTMYPHGMIKRNAPVVEALKNKSVLLLGPRRTGKSYMIRHEIKPDCVFNLLEADTFRRLSARPESIRANLPKGPCLVAIDEVQKLPSLMDEVHLMIEETAARFILTGSSARKLHRSYTSLMAGRAKRMYLHPFNTDEMQSYDLSRVLLYGTLPPVYLSDDPQAELKDYVGLYLKEEILAEALTRKIESFSRFLHAAGLSNAQVLNYEQLGRDAEVPPRTVREYYVLLEDTLFGTTIYPIQSTKNRKSPSRGKFYFFDTGVVASLVGREELKPGTAEYGFAFEHFIFNEINCYKSYFSPDMKIEFWYEPKVGEIDFILNNEVSIEIKSSAKIVEGDLKGMMRFIELGAMKRHLVVSRDPNRRKVGSIEMMSYRDFLSELWGGQIVE